MLSEKIDVTAFMVWLIENYPESAKIMKKDNDYQYKFRATSQRNGLRIPQGITQIDADDKEERTWEREGI